MKINKYTLYLPVIVDYLFESSVDAPQHIHSQTNKGYSYLFSHNRKGSLTVEGAFCGTVFFLAFLSLLYIVMIFYDFGHAQLTLANAVREYECFGTKLGSFAGMNEERAVMMWDEQKELCRMKKTVTIPFLGSRFFRVRWYQQMKYHTYQGRSMLGNKEAMEVYVYITEKGKVYHRNSRCIYLNPGIREVMYDSLESRRNRSGGKYYPCERCGGDDREQNILQVYITPYGDSWHTRKDCSGLKRTIRKVKQSDIGNMPECSKCGRK